MPQHVMAICCKEDPMGKSSIRSEMVWSKLWNVSGSGCAASPAMLMSEMGCSNKPSGSFRFDVGVSYEGNVCLNLGNSQPVYIKLKSK